MWLSKNEFIENKINTKFLKVLVLILLFILLYGINNTYVYYTSLIPFGVGLVFALFFIGFNGYILGILYLLSMILIGFDLGLILQGCNVLAVLSLIQYLLFKNKFKLKKWNVFLLYLLSIMFFVIYSFGDNKENLALFVSIILGEFFLYSCIVFLDATIGKGMLGNINLDEKICGCVILIIFSIGICNGNIYIFELGLIFASLIILITTRMTKSSSTIIMSGVLLGIGFSIYYADAIYISMFVVMSVSSLAFKCNIKVLSAIALNFAYILFCLIFNVGISLGGVLSVAIGSLIFTIIPIKIFNIFGSIFEKSRTVAINNIFNTGKTELINRIKDLSIVFAEMDKVYRDMVKGNLPDQEAKLMLKDELIISVCNDCPNKNRCFSSTGSFMESCFDTIISCGYEKGRLVLIDLPEFLTTNCSKVNLIVQYFNNLLNTYKDYTSAVSNIDMSRILIADQLGGVSKLLETLSKEVDLNILINNKYESIIKEQLSYAGILCLECVIYEKDIHNHIINLIIKKSHYNERKIEKIINKALRSKYKINKVQPSIVVGAVDITMKNTPNYDIAFGSCAISKTGSIVSGDTHSVINIGDGRYMVSICDGMGSGKDASNISRLTLSLIENFYKAGFDNDTILNSINKLLSLNEQEKFSTIDLCIIDGKRNNYDFIKLGATNGYLKRSNGDIEVISSSGLPIGVLENIKPHITKHCIEPMDMIVLVSDGVSDILGDELNIFINSVETINPQTLSEEILNKALECNSGISSDDMTVVCVRVFESV